VTPKPANGVLRQNAADRIGKGFAGAVQHSSLVGAQNVPFCSSFGPTCHQSDTSVNY
jgi:hypothetical protein